LGKHCVPYGYIWFILCRADRNKSLTDLGVHQGFKHFNTAYLSVNRK